MWDYLAMALQLRKFPEDLKRQLKVKALQANKTLAEYVIGILRAAKYLDEHPNLKGKP